MHFAAAWWHRCASLPRDIAIYFGNNKTSHLKWLLFNPSHARSHEFDIPITLSDHCMTLHRQCARYANLVVRFGHAWNPISQLLASVNASERISASCASYANLVVRFCHAWNPISSVVCFYKCLWAHMRFVSTTETNNKACISRTLLVECHACCFPYNVVGIFAGIIDGRSQDFKNNL